MDNETRHRRIAQRFLVSILQQNWREAPTILRQWADDLEGIEASVRVEEQARPGSRPQEAH